MRQPPDVIVAGHLCLDLHPAFPPPADPSPAALFQPGGLLKIGPLTVATGGVVSNTGLAMSRFGCAVGYVAKVGADLIGKAIVDAFRRHGDVTGIKTAPREHSSYTVVLSPPGMDRMFLHFPGTNDTFTGADIDFSLLDGARLFHFGYPTLMDAVHADTGKELQRIFAAAKQRGVATSLDISFPDPRSPAGRADWPAIYRKTLPHVDVFCPSIEEAFFTLDPEGYAARRAAHDGADLLDALGPGDYARIAAAFLNMGCAVVGLKAGRLGWYLRTADAGRLARCGRLQPEPAAWADRDLWCPAFRVARPASATGAGDCSIAGFLTGLLRGRAPATCLKLAAAAGWMNLRAADAIGGLGDRTELEQCAADLPAAALPGRLRADRTCGPDGVWRRRGGSRQRKRSRTSD
ncbi:MAG: carbohydrate kinase family protein [Lentisphaerae bacterium]|nr:carbohydrate kinase family protein [Lentisphaerota bacterium]